jgi:predicted dehydrogenase
MNMDVHDPNKVVRVACVGLGYWGPNVLRCFAQLAGCKVSVCCDLDEPQLAVVHRAYPGIDLTEKYAEPLARPDVDAVVITTPAATHYAMARAALEAGKHVFVEKPLATNVHEGEELVKLAERLGRILFVGHLLVYHPAVTWLREYLGRGELGDVLYMYASRVNLGQVRVEENALWSLGPHDISMILHLLGQDPIEVQATGQSYVREGVEDVVFVTLRFPGRILAHVHVSWLDPHKVRKLTVVGSKKMAVFDDMEAAEKIRLYDKGVDVAEDGSTLRDSLAVRSGDIRIPRISAEEPLAIECRHFLECVRTGRRPLTDGWNGLRVLRVLHAADVSLQAGGRAIALEVGGQP